MRIIYVVSILVFILFSPLAQAGHVVYKSMYSQFDVIQGFGQTEKQAMADAFSAKPPGYSLDAPSWVIDGSRGDYRATRPIIKN